MSRMWDGKPGKGGIVKRVLHWSMNGLTVLPLLLFVATVVLSLLPRPAGDAFFVTCFRSHLLWFMNGPADRDGGGLQFAIVSDWPGAEQVQWCPDPSRLSSFGSTLP